MAYVLVQDVGAGSIRVVKPGDRFYITGHENYVDEFETLEAAEVAAQELRGPTVWAVFWNRGEAKGYVSAEDNGSGNWRGSRDGHYGCVSEWGTQEEAEKALEELYRD